MVGSSPSVPTPARNCPVLLLWSQEIFPSLLWLICLDLVFFCWFSLHCLFLLFSIPSICCYILDPSSEPWNPPWPSHCPLGITQPFLFHIQDSWKIYIHKLPLFICFQISSKPILTCVHHIPPLLPQPLPWQWPFPCSPNGLHSAESKGQFGWGFYDFRLSRCSC